MTSQNPIAGNQALFKLEYPQSLGVYDTYADAQKAVDVLADQNFPVGNLAIVGTDLRLVERVTGRRTWGTVLGQGVMSGLSTGFIVAIFMMILFPTPDFLGQLLTALVIGVAIGLLFAILGYALSRGQRDFTSVTQTVATKYELLCEHKVVAQARELLAKAPGARASQFNQPGPQAWQQQGWGQPGQQTPQPQQPWGGQQYPPPAPPQQWGQQPYPGHGTPPADPSAPQQPHSWQPEQGWAPPAPQPPQDQPQPGASDPDGPWRTPSAPTTPPER